MSAPCLRSFTRTCLLPSKTFHPGSLPSGTLFDLPTKIARRKELEDKMGQGGFWDHQESAKTVVSEVKILKTQIEPVQDLLQRIEDVRALYQLGEEAGDKVSIEEADRVLADLERRSEKLEVQALLSDKNDPLNCFVTIQAGAGG